MRIGIPKEIKIHEGRVVLVPQAAAELVADGHEVLLQSSAGVLSGYGDDAYRQLGVTIVADAEALYADSEMILKVKEPQPEELDRLRKDHLLFSYLHLAAEPALLQRLLDIGLTAVAFETVELSDGQLPLLMPMSDIAGRLAVQTGATLLQQQQGGKGVLLGGLPAAKRGNVVILGGGTAGGNAAIVAAGLGANVTVFDLNRHKLEAMRSIGNNVTGLYPYGDAIEEAVLSADLVIGAILVPGAKAVHLVREETVRRMEKGSVIIDIAVDQGGCVETTHATSYADPTYIWEGIVHFCVANMPGAVPRSASQALSASLVRHVKRLAAPDWQACAELRAGINVADGKLIHPALQPA